MELKIEKINIELKQEEIEAMKIIMNYFQKKEIANKEVEILWALLKAGYNEPILSTYLMYKKIYG